MEQLINGKIKPFLENSYQNIASSYEPKTPSLLNPHYRSLVKKYWQISQLNLKLLFKASRDGFSSKHSTKSAIHKARQFP
jgi:hypothetical protein